MEQTGPVNSDIVTIENTDLSFGAYSFCIRAKVDSITDCAIFAMTAYFVGDDGSKTKLKSVDINANMFKAVSTYQTIGFVFDYARANGKTGKKLELVIGKPSVSSGSGSPKITIDYAIINRATPAIYAIE